MAQGRAVQPALHTRLISSGPPELADFFAICILKNEVQDKTWLDIW